MRTPSWRLTLRAIDDAQPRIRGKCLLELAGYDLSQLPLVALWNGLSIEWPMEAHHGDVPNW
jgi:hypothetical protein